MNKLTLRFLCDRARAREKSLQHTQKIEEAFDTIRAGIVECLQRPSQGQGSNVDDDEDAGRRKRLRLAVDNGEAEQQTLAVRHSALQAEHTLAIPKVCIPLQFATSYH